MKILIDNGGYNFKNNGDSAMLYVTASRLHKKYPQAEINVFTCAPNSLKEIIPFAVPVLVNGRRQWSNEWNILGGFHKLLPACTYSWLQDKENIFKVKYPNVARRWIERRLSKRGYDTLAMRDFLDTITQADFVVACGGGYITDPFENHACELLQTLALAQGCGKPTAMFGQGLGPAKSQNILAWAKRVLPKLNVLSLRENLHSKSFSLAAGVLLNKISVTGDDAIELAHSMTPSSIGNAIGVNLRISSYSGLSGEALDKVKNILNKVAINLDTGLCGIPISFHDDDSDLHSLRRLLGDDVFDNVGALDSPASVIEQAGRCRVVVTGSYHGGVFSLSQGVSVVAVAASDYYRHKFEGLANQFGVGCQIVDRDSPKFEAELEAAIYKAWKNADTVRPILLEKAQEQINLSDATYGLFMESIDAV